MGPLNSSLVRWSLVLVKAADGDPARQHLDGDGGLQVWWCCEAGTSVMEVHLAQLVAAEMLSRREEHVVQHVGMSWMTELLREY